MEASQSASATTRDTETSATPATSLDAACKEVWDRVTALLRLGEPIAEWTHAVVGTQLRTLQSGVPMGPDSSWRLLDGALQLRGASTVVQSIDLASKEKPPREIWLHMSPNKAGPPRLFLLALPRPGLRAQAAELPFEARRAAAALVVATRLPNLRKFLGSEAMSASVELLARSLAALLLRRLEEPASLATMLGAELSCEGVAAAAAALGYPETVSKRARWSSQSVLSSLDGSRSDDGQAAPARASWLVFRLLGIDLTAIDNPKLLF
jgi:hypothetical protein